MTSSGLERLAQVAYEAHRGALPTPVPRWEDLTEQEQQAWRAAMSAVTGQTGITVAEAGPTQSLSIEAGNLQHTYHADFTIGRRGNFAITDEYASSHHARIRAGRGLWYVEDLGSTNGTFLNGRRIHAPQLLNKGDKIRIGHTVMTVTPELGR